MFSKSLMATRSQTLIWANDYVFRGKYFAATHGSGYFGYFEKLKRADSVTTQNISNEYHDIHHERLKLQPLLLFNFWNQERKSFNLLVIHESWMNFALILRRKCWAHSFVKIGQWLSQNVKISHILSKWTSTLTSNMLWTTALHCRMNSTRLGYIQPYAFNG